MKGELNNRAIWYPQCDEDKMIENYKDTMFYHLTEGVFRPFVDLVKKSESDNSIPTLMLCFRSNKDSESVTIYYNNHIVWDLGVTKTGPRVSISANHARYSKNWKDVLSSVGMDRIELIEKERKLKEEKKEININQRCILKGKFTKEDAKNYAEKSLPHLIKMIDDYFDIEKDKDYFKGRKAYKAYNRRTNKHIEGKRDLVEKKRQQEYYLKNRNKCGGYFVYDMEYAHEYGSAKERDADFVFMDVHKANQADCLAVKYDDDGKPRKLSFIEIKSVKTSMIDNDVDGSGLRAHMINMDKYITMHLDYIKLRLKEAKDILTLYYKLGLRGVSKDMSEADLSELGKEHNQEIVLVYTDSAKEYIETPRGKKWLDDTLEAFPTEESAYDIVHILQVGKNFREAQWNT